MPKFDARALPRYLVARYAPLRTAELRRPAPAHQLARLWAHRHQQPVQVWTGTTLLATYGDLSLIPTPDPTICVNRPSPVD